MIIIFSGLLLLTPNSRILTQRVYSFQSRSFDHGTSLAVVLDRWSSKDTEYSDLSFLPIEVDYLPPKTDLILKKVTLSYIQSDHSSSGDLYLQEILQNIDDEYSFSYLPVIVGNYSLDTRSDPDILAFCKILSFAVLHRLPIEITLVLMDDLPQSLSRTSPTIEPLILSLKSCLQKDGWCKASFPRGLPLQLRRSSRYEKYLSFAQKTFLTRPHDVAKATQAVFEAAMTKPPIKLKRRDEILTELAYVKVGRSFMAESAQSLPVVTSNFFPTRRKLSKRVQQYSNKVVADRYGCYFAYLLLRLVWNSWRLLARSMIPSASTLEISTKLRAISILSVILIRLAVSILLSPSTEGAFRFLIKMTKMRPNTAEKLLKFALFCDSFFCYIELKYFRTIIDNNHMS